MLKKNFINHQIRAKEVRVIDQTGKQLGIISLTEALRLARESNLDLIQVTEKTDPPVCKITDHGKYLYQQKKKEKSVKASAGELKGIRLTFKISEHDLKTRAKQAEKFLKKGNKVRIEMKLRGRERALQDFAKEKIMKFIEILRESTPIKTEREIQKKPRGLTTIISKQ
ncbi:MAG: translation initiation factor IF-3 [Patescibacteria group bacterium]|nr:translation initiation factor IF-3 [Patescibacteria group bacterium]